MPENVEFHKDSHYLLPYSIKNIPINEMYFEISKVNIPSYFNSQRTMRALSRGHLIYIIFEFKKPSKVLQELLHDIRLFVPWPRELGFGNPKLKTSTYPILVSMHFWSEPLNWIMDHHEGIELNLS